MASDTLAPTACSVSLSPSSPATLDAVYAAEAYIGSLPQVEIATEHVLHGGMYARTVRVPAGIAFTGTLIKVPTVVILHGTADVLNNDEWVHVDGYYVFLGSAGRKQVVVTRSAIEMTMLFPCTAATVEEAERAFTDEFANLMSHCCATNSVTITGE